MRNSVKMAIQEIKCLFSYKFGAENYRIAERLQIVLHSFAINLEVDIFPPGVDCNTHMQSLGVEAVIFLCSPESVSSASVQVELSAAQRQGIPVLVIRQSGEVPAHLRGRSYWDLPQLDSPEFHSGAEELAAAIQLRVSFHRTVNLLKPDNSFHETIEAARAIATDFEPTLLAEYACELANRYSRLSDPTTRFWIALSLGKAKTPQAAKLLDKLPLPGHPLESEGIRQAKAMLRDEPPAA